MIKSILLAVKYIHDKTIIHRDLKPSLLPNYIDKYNFLGNILLSDKNDLTKIKLIDFGLSIYQETENKTAGTMLYMAPEII